jgi:hypothetical protein
LNIRLWSDGTSGEKGCSEREIGAQGMTTLWGLQQKHSFFFSRASSSSLSLCVVHFSGNLLVGWFAFSNSHLI